MKDRRTTKKDSWLVNCLSRLLYPLKKKRRGKKRKGPIPRVETWYEKNVGVREPGSSGRNDLGRGRGKVEKKQASKNGHQYKGQGKKDGVSILQPPGGVQTIKRVYLHLIQRVEGEHCHSPSEKKKGERQS